MSMKGVTIEKLSFSWLQLLSAAFLIGGFVYTSAATFRASQEFDEFKDTYTPIINKVVEDSGRQEKLYTKLDNTLTTLNENIITLTAVRAVEAEEVDEMKDDIKSLQNRTSALEFKAFQK